MADNLWDLLAQSDEAYARWKADRSEENRLAWRALWSINLTCPGAGFLDNDGAKPGDFPRCTPTVLSGDREDPGEELPNWLHYRGACLGCGWVGEPVDSENAAAEDAHDHAWPGWRDLPVFPDRAYDPNPNLEKERARWLAKIMPLMPPGWIEAGGPVRTLREAPGNRHVPLHTPWGGYDMACGKDEPRAGQQQLF